jgi:hypothetical protein
MGTEEYKISVRQTEIHKVQPLVLDYKLKYDHSNIKMCNECEYKSYERKYFNPFNPYFLMHLYMPTLFVNCWNNIFMLHIQVLLTIFVSTIKKQEANRNFKCHTCQT